MVQEDSKFFREVPRKTPDHDEVIKPAVVEPEQVAMPAANARDHTVPPSDTATPFALVAYGSSPHSRPPPQVGSTVKHYELLRKLGEGAMGTVYLARDTTLGRLVAIKVLQIHTGPSAGRFLIEAQATARCRHDNIVVIHEVDDFLGYPYMVLEYLEGCSLREWMVQRGRPAVSDSPAEQDASSGGVSLSLAVELILPVVRALACAHKLGIVHRDLKPENIFLTSAGRVVVLDFGIAKRLDVGELSAFNASAWPHHEDVGLTQDGALLGTLPYMSPEQLRCQDVDARSDLWTVGIILYELVAGARPFSYRSGFELLAIAASEEPMPSVRDKRPDAGELGAIIDRCLRKQRDERYGSAEELLAELETLGSGRKARELGEEASPFAGLSALHEADAERFVGREREILSLTGRLRNQPLLIFAIISVIATVVSILSIGVKRQAARADQAAVWAEQEAMSAQNEARQARNATRMAAARELDQKDPTTMLALLREVEPPGMPRGWAELVGKALRSGLARELRAWGTRGIYDVAWGPDSQHVVIALRDGTARVWIPGDAAEPIVLRGHQALLRSAAFSPDGMRIVTASRDKTVRVWNSDGSGEPIVLRGHEAPVHAAVFSPDGKLVVTASADKTVRVWNADGSGQPVVFRPHDGEVNSAAFSPDGKRIVTGSADKTARVWSFDGSGQPVVLRGHEDAVNWAAFSPDGRHVVTGSDDKTARVWNADGSGEPVVLRGHEAPVMRAAFSPDGKRILTGSSDKTARVWSADGVGEPLVLRGHEGDWVSAAWSPDGTSIVTSAADGTTRVYRIDSLHASAPTLLRGHAAGVWDVAFSSDNQRIVTASSDKTARVWRIDGSGPPVVLRGHEGPISTAAFSPDNQHIVTGSDDETARVWRIDGSGPPVVLRGHEGPVYAASFSPDSQRLVTGSADKTARVWIVNGSAPPVVLRGHEQAVTSASFSPDGKHVATESADQTMRVWNADGSGEARVYRDYNGLVGTIAWSHDGERIIVGGRDKMVRVWRIDHPGEPVVLRGHELGITSVAWSPDDKRLVSSSADGTVRIWNADGSGQPVILRGHERGAHFAAFSPDGRRIVTTSADGTARVWNADGSGESYVLSHGQEVIAARWSPDGAHIATVVNYEKIARVWPVLAPLRGIDDPRLWTATPYCLSIARRIALLNVPEARARADQAACERRVQAAGVAATRSAP